MAYQTAIGSAPTLTTMHATALKKVLFDAKLRQPEVLPSIFTNMRGQARVVNKEIMIEKTGIITTINADPSGPQQEHVMGMVKPYRYAPVMGTTADKMANIEGDDLLWAKLYYNEFFKAFKRYGWGFNFNETAYLKLAQTNMPRLLLYMAEAYDWRCQEALMLMGDPALAEDPVGYTQQFNPNWLIPGLTEANFPAYDVDAPTKVAGSADSDGYYSSRYFYGADSFAETLAAQILSASGTGETPSNMLTGEFLQQMINYLRAVIKMPTVPLDGIDTIVVAVPSRVKNWLLNKNNTGSLGELITNKAAYQQNRGSLVIPNELGRLVDQGVLLVENMRGPTLTVGGSEGAYTLTPGFMMPGDNDDRNNADWSNTSGSTNYVFDVVEVLGAEALFHLKVDEMNTKLSESEVFGQNEAKGAYIGDGIQIAMFDKDAASRTGGAEGTRTGIYRGSALIPVGRTAFFH
jgi:hypothetical protein